ncbi:MAG: ATP-binding protein [Aquihabitans sp.]
MPSEPETGGRSLRAVAAGADADRFVGRATELAVADEVLGDDTASRVLHVRGPGGIGKSALLRAIGRRAADRGDRVVALDTRQDAAAFDEQIARAGSSAAERVLVVIDEVDALGSRLPAVRDQLLDALPASARIVIAGRAELDPSWRADGLDAILVELSIAPLDDADARELLDRRGVVAHHQDELIAWAQGSPLALTVASSSPGSVSGPAGAEELEAKLTSWLAGDAVLSAPSDLVEVAALAPAVDARLLAAALPSQATRDGMRQLIALPVVEQIGNRAVLHAVLAAAVRARLEATAPERKRILTRRIVEHLAARAQLGDMQSLIELSQFISDPRLRQAVSGQPSPSLFPSRPRPGELAAFAASQGFDSGGDWPELTSWFGDGTVYSLCIRRTDGSISMLAWFTRVTELRNTGPVSASLQAAADASAADPARSFAGIVLFADATEHERMEAARLGAGALMLQHRVGDMQAVLIHYPEPDRRPIEAISAIADDVTDELPRLVALSDFRPFGAVGFVEQIVLAELGVPGPTAGAAALLVEDDDEERQAQLRELLDQVFDGSEEDQRLRRAIELVHLGPHRSERERLNALHVSRSTWFRLLRQARERVLQAGLSPDGPTE